jgi:RNA polymerase sigma-70 factor (ECF subfamily)
LNYTYVQLLCKGKLLTASLRRISLPLAEKLGTLLGFSSSQECVTKYAFWRGQRERSPRGGDPATGAAGSNSFVGSLGTEDVLVYADGLFNLASYLTSNSSEAEDLVQETYARALAARAFFRGGSVKAWLFQILRNAFVDAYRKGKVHGVTTELEVWEGGGEVGHGPVEVTTEQMRALMASDVEKALRALSEDARTTILLDVEGLREAEIADVLGCAAGTVKSRLARARRLLRLKLKDYAR